VQDRAPDDARDVTTPAGASEELDRLIAERDELARRIGEITGTRGYRALTWARALFERTVARGRPVVPPAPQLLVPPALVAPPVGTGEEPTDPVAGVAAAAGAPRGDTSPELPHAGRAHSLAGGPVEPVDGRRRALMVDHVFPTPDHDTGSRRTVGICAALRDLDYDVFFLSDDGRPAPHDFAPFAEHGVTVVEHPVDVRALLAQWADVLDVVVLSRAGVAARHLPLVRESAPAATVLFDPHDLAYLREERRARFEDVPTSLVTAHRELELAVVRATDATVVSSAYEQDLLRDLCPSARVGLLPIREVPRVVPSRPDGRADLLFVGSFAHPPNADGVRWFADAVMPRIREAHPSVRFEIVGADPPPHVQALDGEWCDVHGWVPELGPFYDRARVVVVPVRFGAGTKGKISEAMAAGVPVVTTPTGAEGMGLSHGREVLVAERADDFAAEVGALLSDDRRWACVADAALRHASAHHGPDAVRQALADALAESRASSGTRQQRGEGRGR
jgi:glycosyltransferase involved in cell wall biosynthesis